MSTVHFDMFHGPRRFRRLILSVVLYVLFTSLVVLGVHRQSVLWGRYSPFPGTLETAPWLIRSQSD